MNKKSENPALSCLPDHELGLDTDITRRDFIGGTCVGREQFSCRWVHRGYLAQVLKASLHLQ